jgi:RNA polymerase sigma-70 factor (ECF subfamily)
MVLEGNGREVIDACQRGEQDAFRLLFETYRDKVYSIALRYAGDSAIAMDIAQDVFLKLLSSIQDFRGGSSFDTWLYRLVVNRCIDEKRRSWRLAPLLDDLISLLDAPEEGVLDEMMRDEMGEQVQKAVGHLPPQQRIVVVLRYTEGLSYEEIAAAVGCSLGTVASRLNRAHKTLERRLSHAVQKRGGLRG